jgi:hypothetical protein
VTENAGTSPGTVGLHISEACQRSRRDLLARDVFVRRYGVPAGIRNYVEAETVGDSAKTTSLVAPNGWRDYAYPVGAEADRRLQLS